MPDGEYRLSPVALKLSQLKWKETNGNEFITEFLFSEVYLDLSLYQGNIKTADKASLSKLLELALVTASIFSTFRTSFLCLSSMCL